jgi:hypothetical protein
MKVTEIVLRGDGLTATFDDGSVGQVVYKFKNNEFDPQGLSTAQKAALTTYLSESDLSNVTYDPRFVSTGGGGSTDYVTTSSLASTLTSYVTTSSLSTSLADYVTTSSLASTLTSYVTTSSLSTSLADYATLVGLASDSNGAGASLIGLEDSGGNWDATNLEELATEIATSIANPGGGAEKISQLKEDVVVTLASGTEVPAATVNSESFDSGYGSWSQVSTFRTSTVAYAGSHSVAMDVYNESTRYISIPLDLPSGGTLTFRNRRTSNASYGYSRVYWGTWLSTSDLLLNLSGPGNNNDFGAANTWFLRTVTIPAGSKTLYIGVRGDTDNEGSPYHYFDDVIITQPAVTPTVFHFNGVSQDNLLLLPGVEYTFDQSDASNTDELKLSESRNNLGDDEYTSGATYTGTAGTDGQLVFEVPHTAPNKLFPFATDQSLMGNDASFLVGTAGVGATKFDFGLNILPKAAGDASFTAVKGFLYKWSMAAAAADKVVTMPTSPTLLDSFSVFLDSESDTYNIGFSGLINGETIAAGSKWDLVNAGEWVTFQFVDGDIGWRTIAHNYIPFFAAISLASDAGSAIVGSSVKVPFDTEDEKQGVIVTLADDDMTIRRESLIAVDAASGINASGYSASEIVVSIRVHKDDALLTTLGRSFDGNSATKTSYGNAVLAFSKGEKVSLYLYQDDAIQAYPIKSGYTKLRITEHK